MRGEPTDHHAIDRVRPSRRFTAASIRHRGEGVSRACRRREVHAVPPALRAGDGRRQTQVAFAERDQRPLRRRRARMAHDRGGWQAVDAYRAVWPAPSCGAVTHRRRSGDPDPMRLAQGTRLGHYEVISPLGKGRMGEVYLAQDVRLGRRVALKVLPGALADDQDSLARFIREARAASDRITRTSSRFTTSATRRARTSSPINSWTADSVWRSCHRCPT